RTLQEICGTIILLISSTGLKMMLRNIMEQRKEPFLMFQKPVDKQGFIQELEGMMTEFKRHCITPELLEEQILYTEQHVSLQQKMMHLNYVFTNLQALLADKYIDGEDQLQLLTEKISSTYFLQDAEYYIDGFHRFTPKELNIITELLKAGKRMTVALTLDEEVMNDELSEFDLFYQTSETFEVLHELAKAHDIKIEPLHPLGESYEELTSSGALAHLEQYF